MKSIAKKTAARSSTLLHQTQGLHVGGTRVDLNLVVEEMGKTVITTRESSSADICAKVAAGDGAELKIEGDGIGAEASRGVRLGLLEAKLAGRLIKFMRGGNRYQAGVTSCDGNTVKLIVRETYQDPHFAGKPSFPMRRKREVEFRPYTKESLLTRGAQVFSEDDEEEAVAEAPPSAEPEQGVDAVDSRGRARGASRGRHGPGGARGAGWGGAGGGGGRCGGGVVVGGGPSRRTKAASSSAGRPTRSEPSSSARRVRWQTPRSSPWRLDAWRRRASAATSSTWATPSSSTGSWARSGCLTK